MQKYELLYIINPNTTDEEKKKTVELIKSWIETNNGKIDETDEWGIRDLATEFKKCKKGYYVLVKFEIDQDKITEINRRFRINEKVIRYLIIKETGRPKLAVQTRR